MRFVLQLLLVAFVVPLSLSVHAGALRCDGVDDFGIVPDVSNDLDPGQSLTVEAWINLDAYTDLGSAVSGFPGAVALGQGQLSNAGKPGMTVSVPGTSSARGLDDIPLGTWVHLAGTFDGSDIRLYVNGALAGTQSNPGTAINLSEVRICIFAVGTTDLMDGAIDEVRWWNIVRSGQDISADYMQVLSGNEPGLVGYWRFEESSGQDLLDSSGNGNNGFLGSTSSPGSDDPTRIAEGAPVQNQPLPSAQPVPTLSSTSTALIALLLSALGLIAVRSRLG